MWQSDLAAFSAIYRKSRSICGCYTNSASFLRISKKWFWSSKNSKILSLLKNLRTIFNLTRLSEVLGFGQAPMFYDTLPYWKFLGVLFQVPNATLIHVIHVSEIFHSVWKSSQNVSFDILFQFTGWQVLVKISNLREIRILKFLVKKIVKLKWDLQCLARM